MVQNLLLESFDNTGKIDVLGRGVVGVRAEYALLTHIREFQAEYDGPGAPKVRVRLQARLVRLPRRISLGSTSEEFVVQADDTSMTAIVRGVRRGLRQGGQARGRVDHPRERDRPDGAQLIPGDSSGRWPPEEKW